MAPGIVQDIDARLSRLEQDRALPVETNFVQRAYALDTLEFRILDHIENVLYEHGYRQDLAQLQQRAAHLRRQLQAVNAQLFQRLHEEIRAGEDRATALRQWFDRYVGHGPDERNRDPIGYDVLDVFVDGLLCIDGEPEETRPLISGMIGYQATPARFVLALLEHTDLRADDVFYDIGSGLGRVALLVRLLSAAQVKGIEYEPSFCAYAQQRAQHLELTRVSFHNVDARHADYSDGTVFFMYTPFTGRMRDAVLERLRHEACARTIRLIAYGPCTPHVAQLTWLQPIDEQTFRDRDLAIFASTPAAWTCAGTL